MKIKSLKAIGKNQAFYRASLGLGGKGKISAGFDADICFFDTDCDWKLRSVFARGKQHLSEGKLLKKGTFEEL